VVNGVNRNVFEDSAHTSYSNYDGIDGEGRACVPVGLMKTQDDVYLNKVCKVEAMNGPGQPQTCSHLIYTMLHAQ